MKDRLIDTLLLAALPASGKSEIRRYLAHLDADTVRRDFHMGETVQLDDYPYVHLMRRISEELRQRGHDGIFFPSSDRPFSDARDWGTLCELLNEDYDDLRARPPRPDGPAAAWLFARLDAARGKVGAEPALGRLPEPVRRGLEAAVETDAANLRDEKWAEIPPALDGRTVVMEFARGGPEGARMPLEPPHGYAYSLSRLSDAILERASLLYVWVTPEESRRKNDERARPGREGDASILHHGVPEAVMREDYGTDDMAYLLEHSDRPDTIRVETRGRVFHVPVARFDNREDLTSFLREDPDRWPRQQVERIHAALRGAFDTLVATPRD